MESEKAATSPSTANTNGVFPLKSPTGTIIRRTRDSSEELSAIGSASGENE